MSASHSAETTDSKSAGPSTADRTPAIQAKELTKVFGDRVCVDHLSFSVYPGELYALLGDNGAGKTTTINMLTTLLKASSGTAYICGFDVVKQSEKAKAAFGVVSQEVALYGELTAYENLAFIADLYGVPSAVAAPRIEQLLRKAGLADRAHDQAGTFSTGMQRKLSIAIAMLRQPQVIFMDEPTVGLDPASRRQIWEALMDLKHSGITVLLTTHYLEEAQFLADRIGIIRKGKMVMEGNILQLREQIKAGRTITIDPVQNLTSEEFDERAGRFKAKYPGTIELDILRHNILITPPSDISLPDYLDQVIDWLKAENIGIHQFATTEPSLEDIFLSVQSGRTAAG